MSKKKGEEVTIESLAFMIGRGFEETNGQIRDLRNEMNERFGAVETRLERIEERLERVEFNTAAIERRLSVAEDRIIQLARKTGIQFN